MEKNKNEETDVKSISFKVFVYGISVTLFVMAIFCAAMVFINHSLSMRYVEEIKESNERQQTINDLRRNLDFFRGRLHVFDSFLVGRQQDSVKTLITKYLKEKKKKSNKVPLLDFENWIDNLPYHNAKYGIGGQ